MAEYTVYHNPRCSKSRMAVQYLEEKGASFEIIEYLKNIPSVADMQKVLKQLGIKPEALIRKNENDYKEHFKGKELSTEEWIEAMRKFPKLMELPIVIKDDKAVVARPTERIEELG